MCAVFVHEFEHVSAVRSTYHTYHCVACASFRVFCVAVSMAETKEWRDGCRGGQGCPGSRWTVRVGGEGCRGWQGLSPRRHTLRQRLRYMPHFGGSPAANMSSTTIPKPFLLLVGRNACDTRDLLDAQLTRWTCRSAHRQHETR